MFIVMHSLINSKSNKLLQSLGYLWMGQHFMTGWTIMGLHFNTFNILCLKLQRFTQQIQEYKMTNFNWNYIRSLHLQKKLTLGPLVIEKTIKGFGFWLANCARYPAHQKVDPSIPQVRHFGFNNLPFLSH